MMEQSINPYESSGIQQQIVTDPSLDVPLSPVAYRALLTTRVPVLLVGVTSMIIIVMSTVRLFYSNLMMPGGGILVVMIPIIITIIQVILAVRLLQYGAAIGRLEKSCSNEDFERAIEVHSQFWRLFGIISAVSIGLVILSSIMAAV